MTGSLNFVVIKVNHWFGYLHNLGDSYSNFLSLPKFGVPSPVTIGTVRIRNYLNIFLRTWIPSLRGLKTHDDQRVGF